MGENRVSVPFERSMWRSSFGAPVPRHPLETVRLGHALTLVTSVSAMMRRTL